ncbi:MAG: SpoIIE family protein phosphatase, partial [Bacteroidetes bacterium]|nr:SpoIIE family protein phosphatase [Bacteroidota bacterium]
LNKVIWSMIADKSGDVWVSSYSGGVSKYDGKSFTHYTYKEGLTNNYVRRIFQDKYGNIWFCNYKNGVCKFDGKIFTRYGEQNGLSNNDVRSVLEDKNGNLWFGTYGGGVCKYNGNRIDEIEKEIKTVVKAPEKINLSDGKFVRSFTQYTTKEGLSNNFVSSMLQDKNGCIWFGTYGGGVNKYDPTAKDRTGSESFVHFTEKEGLSNNNVTSMLEDKLGNIWFGTAGGGVNKYDGKNFIHYTEKEGLSNNNVLAILEDKSGNIWFGTRFGLSKLSLVNLKKLAGIPNTAKENNSIVNDLLFKNYTFDDGFLGIGCFNNSICEDKTGNIWVGTDDRLTAYHPEGDIADTIAPNIQITGIELFSENIDWVNLEHKKDTSIVLGNGVSVGNFLFDGISKWYSLPENLSLAYNNNYLTFDFIGITQKHSKKVKYQYKLEGIDKNWSAITSRTEAPYGNLPQGTYSFKVKAMNSEGFWSKEFIYTFKIRPPWWKTFWMYVVYCFLSIASVILIVWWNGRRLRARAVKLTEEVKKATVTIVEKNKIVEEQKKIVEEKNKDITDSINYALRIQQAFLPDKEEIHQSFPQSFILFKPKDIVSGDFYFFYKSPSPSGNEKKDHVFIAAADCTGHGVPGAFMSLVGSERLTDAVQQSDDTSEILSLLNKGVKISLKQSAKNESTRDGMDIALCSVDITSHIVKYAGANRPIWIIRNGEKVVEEIKATKAAIGGLTNDDQYFQTHEIKLQKGDTFYICTDGYSDQFNGNNGKKLMSKKLKEIFVDIQNKTMSEQEQYLDNFVEKWREGIEQVDDILVIGIRF